MVLLDLLSGLPRVELIVAHFDHGVRSDSGADEALVKETAARHGLPFESAKGKLGGNASEEAARAARYNFLEGVRLKYKATAIITAHHQDDLIETAFINLLRGTGRRGLVALAINPKVARPLLKWTKEDILSYAKKQGLEWREDKTNQDDTILRNYIRRQILPRLSAAQRRSLISDIDKIAGLEAAISPRINELSRAIVKGGSISRRSFTALPVDLGGELVLHWLRQRRVSQPDKKTIDRLNLALRASKRGTVHPVKAGLDLMVGEKSARFNHSL